MNRLILIAAAAVIGVGLLGGAALIAGGGIGPSPTLTPTSAPVASAPPSAATPSTAASTAAGGTPAALKYTWVGAPRDLPGLGQTIRLEIQFGPTGACIDAKATSPGCAIAASNLDDATADTLHFSSPTKGDCAAGDTGSYPYSVSPGGKVLTIGPGTDTCAMRAAAYPGTWYRALCTQPENGCLGDLEAGTYASQFIAPKLDASASWEAPWGAITYTVPDGWSNSVDFPMELVLLPSSTYASYTDQGPPAGLFHDVQILADPAAAKHDAACNLTPDAAVDRSADGLAAWIAHLPSVTVANPQVTTIDGHHARRLDLAVNASGAFTCPDGVRAALLFTPAIRDTGNVPDFGMGAGELVRLYLVDLGGGHTAAVVIDDTDGSGKSNETRFQSFVAAATPIVESLHFK